MKNEHHNRALINECEKQREEVEDMQRETSARIRRSRCTNAKSNLMGTHILMRDYERYFARENKNRGARQHNPWWVIKKTLQIPSSIVLRSFIMTESMSSMMTATSKSPSLLSAWKPTFGIDRKDQEHRLSKETSSYDMKQWRINKK